MLSTPSFDTSGAGFFAALVEQTSDILTASDMDFRPLTWNSAAERIYGLKASQVIGKDLRDFLTLHYQQSSRNEVRDILAREGEGRGEAWFERPTDQKIVTILIGFKVMRDQQGV